VNVRVEAVAVLHARLGHEFSDPTILERALTHSSVGDGGKSRARDNERLEFLGDRVLGLLTAERLIAQHPEATEGDLAPRLNALVSRQTCARVARRMNLGPALRLSGAESRTGGRDKDSILAGAVEAVIAALYADGGLDAVRPMFQAFWSEEFDNLGAPRPRDPKTALQEWAQGQGKPLPAYTVVTRDGPDHAPLFTVEVKVEGLVPATGKGASRQAAEKAAAQAVMDREPSL
jgi:ribonuclease-3